MPTDEAFKDRILADIRSETGQLLVGMAELKGEVKRQGEAIQRLEQGKVNKSDQQVQSAMEQVIEVGEAAEKEKQIGVLKTQILVTRIALLALATPLVVYIIGWERAVKVAKFIAEHFGF